MFNGIISHLVRLEKTEPEESNLHLTFHYPFTNELYIDQSIAHNGVCLTITDITGETYRVTAIEETLNKTNLRFCKPGDMVNFERAAIMGSRIDGHFVQGHVDSIVKCTDIQNSEGSWLYYFEINPHDRKLLVNKGSVCLNGVSLTVVSVNESLFHVAVIPYTYENTNFKYLRVGDFVNIEFDILGKYINQYLERMQIFNQPG